MSDAADEYAERFLRAALSSAATNDLPDSAFAYIESGGKKDDDGKTTPRKLRHYPVHDKAHADNALARANTQAAGDDADAKKIATAALPKIKAAVAKFSTEQKMASMSVEERGTYREKQRALSDAISNQPSEGGKLSAYLHDFDENAATYESGGKLYQVPYEEQGDGTCSLGDPQEVKPVTSYQPVESKSAPRNPATPKRAFSSLVEQAPAHTIEAQVRLDDGADANIAHFVGYPSPTGVAYFVRDWLGEYQETMDPGCYTKTLREQVDVPTLFNHDGVPMASTASGTKRLAEDGKGLREESEFDRRDALTNSIVVQLQRGVLSKMSISFRAIKDAWNDAYDNRNVGEAALYDTSIVTYPASPTAGGGLVEAMRSALGREGRSLWLAESELSVRSVLPVFVERREVSGDEEELLERALRALVHADEVVSRSNGGHGRARTFRIGQVMLELRAGKALSSANQTLLNTALTALSSADKQHAKLAASHSAASDAISTVLGNDSGDGKDSNSGAGSGAPINPQDGAGPRSASLKLQRQREAELRALRR